MATSNTDLFSILEDLEVSTSEIASSELFLESVMSSKYPEVDFRQGTAARDLVLRPAATLAAMLRKGLYFIYNNNTISAITEDTPNEQVDKLLSNWFMQRKSSSPAIINARLYFLTSKSINLPSTTFFSTDNTLKFFPAESVVIPASALAYDAASKQYFIDINLTAEAAGSDYNLSSGSLLYFTLFDSYFLRAEINYLVTESSNAETNLEFVARTKNAISTRNLINEPSIDYLIKDKFSSIKYLQVVGHGDPAMLRDIEEIRGAQVHLGGKVDIYIKGQTSSIPYTATTDSYGRALLTGPIYRVERSSDTSADDIPADAPFTVKPQGSTTLEVYQVSINTTTGIVGFYSPSNDVKQGQHFKIYGLGNATLNGQYVAKNTSTDGWVYAEAKEGVPTTYTGTGYIQFISMSADVAMSQRGTIVVDFGDSYADKNVTVDIYYHQLVESVQEFLDDADNRIVTADYLARGFNIYDLDITVETHASIPSDIDIESTITTYIDSLVPGAPFIMADLISALVSAGVLGLKTPVDIDYKKWSTFVTETPITGKIIDILEPTEYHSQFKLNSLKVNPT